MTASVRPGTAVSGAGRETPAGEPLDVRLALGAAAAWLAVVLLLDVSAGAATWWALFASVGGVAALVAARRGAHGAVFRVWGLGCFCVALVLFPLAGRLAQLTDSPTVVLARRHVTATLELKVSSDPRVLAAKGPAGTPRVAVETTVETVTRDGHRPVSGDGDVLVLGDAGPWRDVLPGQRVRVRGSLQPDLGGGVLSVTIFERGPPELLATPPWWQRTAGTVRAALRRSASVLPDQERGLLPGLVDGDTANLDPVLVERFRTAGLTHLVAVSGTNCSIVVGAVLLVLRRMRVRPWACALIGGLVLVTFVIVARPSPSVLRAATMATIALVSLAGGRPRAAVPALSAVVLVLLILDPSLGRSASFAMSVLATAGLLVLAPGWARRLRARGVPIGLAESVAVAAAAHLVTAPVVAGLSGQVSVVAIAANVLAEPVVAVTTILGFLAAVVSPMWLGAGTVFAWSAGWPCRWLVGVAEFFGGLHGAVIPWPGGMDGGLVLAGLLAVLVLIALRAGARRVLAAGAITALTVLLPVQAVSTGWPPARWLFVACDISQGDSLVLNAGAGAAVLVDAGPDPVAVDRCLDDLDVTALPLVVITHLHADHVAGLPGAVRGRAVGQIMAGPLPEPEGGEELITRIAGREHLVVGSPRPGTTIRAGAVRLEVLGPRTPAHGTRSDPNNSSLVMRATVGGTRFLLSGDAEVEEQDAILASGADLAADVLKVPHHGSAYSSPAFLDAAHARTAIVSVGLGNDYGHPSPVLLHEIAQLGIPLYRTDRDGDVAFVGTAHGGVGGSEGLAIVVHGTARRTVGAAGSSMVTPADRDGSTWSAPPREPSALGARMTSCLRDRSNSTICPRRYPRCSCSSATRNSWSTAPSARSPPPPERKIPIRSRPNGPAANSKDQNCMSCWAPACSAMPACW